MASQGPCGEKISIKNTFIHIDEHNDDYDYDANPDGYSTPPRKASKQKPPLSCPPAVLGPLSDSTRSTLEDPGSPTNISIDAIIKQQTQLSQNSPPGTYFSSGGEFLSACSQAGAPATPVTSKTTQVGLQQTPPPVSPLRSYQGAPFAMKDVMAPVQSAQAAAAHAAAQAAAQATAQAAAHAAAQAAAQASPIDWTNPANSMALAQVVHSMQLGYSSYAASLAAANSAMPMTPNAPNFMPGALSMASMVTGPASYQPSTMAAGAMPFIPGSTGYVGSPARAHPGQAAFASPNARSQAMTGPGYGSPLAGPGHGSPSTRTPPLPSPGMNTFKLQLRKVDGGRMGLNASTDSSGFLKVSSVDENSAMGSYNKQVKGSTKPSVRSGDIILSVNGFTSPQEMSQQLQERMFVSLEIAQQLA
mmetsp:Transcript_97387/g.173455  ORF Transcript_97387/g.173455 Transcript_97387/m.173455 type:complete len:417 (+) Transcript_97387:73-1323(+)